MGEEVSLFRGFYAFWIFLSMQIKRISLLPSACLHDYPLHSLNCISKGGMVHTALGPLSFTIIPKYLPSLCFKFYWFYGFRPTGSIPTSTCLPAKSFFCDFFRRKCLMYTSPLVSPLFISNHLHDTLTFHAKLFIAFLSALGTVF